MRPIQFFLLRRFKPSRDPLSLRIQFSPDMKPFLQWWSCHSNLSKGRPFSDNRPSTTLSTDASNTGWGASWGTRSAAGVWSPHEKTFHINILELLAVRRAIETWSRELKGTRVSILSDNSTTVAYLNRQGGTRSLHLCLETWDLLLLCQSLNISLRATHLAGEQNVLADALSRGTFSHNEWTLSQPWADYVFHIFGRPHVDLFATRHNCRLPTFCSRPSGSASLGDRCSDSRLGRHVGIRLPSLASTTESAAQTSSIQNGNVVDSPILAETTLVSSHSQPSGGSTLPVSERPPSPLTSQGQDSSSRPTVPKANCLEIVNKRLLSKGLSRRSADLAAGARRRSTITTYDSRLEKFFDWAEHHSVDPLEAPVNALCSFFVSLFDEGKQVSTIKNYRSAIASVHSGFSDGSTVGSNQTILTLLKGMFNKRPPRRRLAPSWSINEVLSSFSSSPYEPIQNSPLDALTKKTIFLVAAASSRRRSEIHALSVKPGFIRFTPDGVHLLPNPSFLAKNQSESFSPDHIFLPSMSTTSSVREDRFICPVRALKWYIEKTKSIRKSDALFLIPRSPYTPASKDTISRWLVEIIAPFAAPDDSPKAHDVRAHASSIAWFRGVPLQDIMRAASWKTPSTFVASYLTNVVSPRGSVCQFRP
ncbi:hypothetical protein HOLleu_36791 [Holothuria leucospilota]|uniref:Core-binding (CB) domain-containing protein n=1 Tax=Holothuria leucospilota TaxID=206669 RepID=A0A9Q0YKC2_HOLLE|nr:hypothetical protein HOLleu_36791 [Holothuria leucospilota]